MLFSVQHKGPVTWIFFHMMTTSCNVVLNAARHPTYSKYPQIDIEQTLIRREVSIGRSEGSEKDLTKKMHPRKQSSWGQHGAQLGPVGPRWAPCWPHEPCYHDALPEWCDWLINIQCRLTWVMWLVDKHNADVINEHRLCPTGFHKATAWVHYSYYIWAIGAHRWALVCKYQHHLANMQVHFW